MEPKLITLGKLLHTYEPAVLVKAIEKHGLFGWDQYGIWGEFKPRSDTVSMALEKLSEVYYAKIEASRSETPKPWFGVLLGKNLIGPLHHLGWISGQMPDFGRIVKELNKQPVFIPITTPKMRNDTVNAIVAGLLYFSRVQPIRCIEQEPLTQNEVIEYLVKKFDFPGVSKSNLEKLFSEANNFIETFGTTAHKLEKAKKGGPRKKS